MGKRSYLGGSTVIGPHTPDWFSHGETDEEELKRELGSSDNIASDGVSPKKSGKTTRHQRRKRARARLKAKEQARAATLVKHRPELTLAEQIKIDDLHMSILGLKRQIGPLNNELKRNQAELRELLQTYGFPTDRYPVGTGNDD